MQIGGVLQYKLEVNRGEAKGPGSWDLPTAKPPRTPSQAGTPCLLPLAPSQRGAEGGGRGSRPARLEGGGRRGPGSWCSSESRSVGIPRVGSPQRAGTPRIFP